MLLPSNSTANKEVAEFPQLFPLSWLAARLRESQGQADWTKEFESKTGLKAGQSELPTALALQIFNERVAQRIYLVAEEG